MVGFFVFEIKTTTALNDPQQPPEGDSVIVNGEWVVTDVRKYYNCTIIMNGNLTIKNGGTLTFRNVTLIMNNTFNGRFNIEVQSGGSFYIYDFDNSPSTNLDRSNITSAYPDYHYMFWVRKDTNFKMKNSELHECGYSSPNLGLKIETNRTEIKYSIISDNHFGIHYYYSLENNITDNIFSNNLYGLYLDHSDGNNITYNDAHSNSQHGMYLWYSNSNQIVDNIVNSNNRFGVNVFRSRWNNITNNSISDNEEGIHFTSSGGNIINDNNISNNEDGVFLEFSTGNNITSNTISLNNYSAIYLIRSEGDNITGNIMNENSIIISGNLLEHWNMHNINVSNYVNGKPIYYWKNRTGGAIPQNAGQVILANCTNVTVENLEISNNSIGIELGFCSNSNITGNKISSSYYSIDITNSHGNKFMVNNISNCVYGITLWGSDRNHVTSNSASHNFYGIYIGSSDESVLISNYLMRNNYGISIGNSLSADLKNNSLIENGIEINGNSLEYWNTHNIDASNKVNGKSVYYWNNQTGGTIPPDAGQVILANCTNITIEDQTIPFGSIGIEVGFSSQINIIGNNVSLGNQYGIWLVKSHESIIAYNNASSNDHSGIFLWDSYDNNLISNMASSNNYYGIRLSNSNGNNITNNTAKSNNNSGIHLSSSNLNNVTWNTHANNGIGISFFFSDDNNISDNIATCNEYGIHLQYSSYNRIYHNYLIGNIYQAYDDRDDNYWDNGYPDGGNFWLDYGGIDIFQGSGQNLPGSDGIGDDPYDIDSDSQDNYPLMEPYETIPPQIQLISPMNNSVLHDGVILDFYIYDDKLYSVNYSLNGSANVSLSEPFNISTSGWEDGEYTIQINALDILYNSNSLWYSFTVDSSPPNMILNDPENNSIISNTTPLDFIIIDPNLMHVNYSVNGGAEISLSDPFDISISGYPDGNYTVQVNALDSLGNSNSSLFFFVIDSTKPTIILNTPYNNSVFASGMVLDLSIIDANLMKANYNVDEGENIPLPYPFDINRMDWEDGQHKVQINTLDFAGNSNSSWFLFTIDSKGPSILLRTPANNTNIQVGTILDFDIVDPNLKGVNYSVDGGSYVSLLDPFNILTADWVDGGHTVHIFTLDLAGNSNSSWFFFTIDSTPPEIRIDPNLNHSTIFAGRKIQINISEADLANVVYSLDGGEYLSLDQAYIINTIYWTDGPHIITIKADDTAGNEARIWFEITIDAISPLVVSTNPQNNSMGIDTDTIITITFNEAMNQTIMEDYLTISPSNDFTIQWDSSGTTLSISFAINNLNNGMKYNITIDHQMKDIAGNLISSDFLLTFTTRFPPLDTDSDGIPDNEDNDDDNDGYLDDNDDFPLNPLEWIDTDSDGIGNNADLDDDNDGHIDELDAYPLNPDLWKKKVDSTPMDLIWILALLAIIIICVFVSMILLRRKGKDSGEITDFTEDEGSFIEEKDFETKETPPPPAERQEPPPPPPPPPP